MWNASGTLSVQGAPEGEETREVSSMVEETKDSGY